MTRLERLIVFLIILGSLTGCTSSEKRSKKYYYSGGLLKEIKYSDGKRSYYRYDEEGRLAASIEPYGYDDYEFKAYEYDSDDRLKVRRDSYYYAYGDVEKIDFSIKTYNGSVYTYFYQDDLLQRIEIRGNHNYTRHYSYDSERRVIEERFIDDNYNTLNTEVTYKYNDLGRVVEKKTKRSGSTVTEEYEYDERGRVSRKGSGDNTIYHI